jgi:uncharacterized protein YukE
LDTKSFDFCINEFNSCITAFNNIMARVWHVNDSLYECWKGEGKNAFDSDYTTVSYNLKDISELMGVLKDSLIVSRDFYFAADERLRALIAEDGSPETETPLPSRPPIPPPPGSAQTVNRVGDGSSPAPAVPKVNSAGNGSAPVPATPKTSGGGNGGGGGGSLAPSTPGTGGGGSW